MDTFETIRTRRSIRSFQDRPIPEENLKQLGDCARLAPTGNNRQLWKFLFVTDKAKLAAIGKAAPSNSPWMGNAAAAALVFVDKSHSTIVEDGCAATENIILSATAMGIGSCWIACYHRAHAEAIKKLVNCPDNLELVSMVALGWPNESPSRPKKPLEEVVLFNSF